VSTKRRHIVYVGIFSKWMVRSMQVVVMHLLWRGLPIEKGKKKFNYIVGCPPALITML